MFKDVLNSIIKQKNLTIYRVAKESKIPESSIYAWALGERKPSYKNVARLANYFGCSVDFLLEREPEQNQNGIKMLKVAKSDIKPPRILTKSVMDDIICENAIDLGVHISVEEVLETENDFWLTMCDDSMKDINIVSETEVWIRRCEKPQDGDIAAVYVKESGIFLRIYSEVGDKVRLECANTSCPAEEYNKEDVVVLGKAVEIKNMI